jgi:ABC-2 type transport system permease protein
MGIIAPWLPSGALADALTACLVHQTAPPVISIVVLAAWLAMGAGLASRTFRWS